MSSPKSEADLVAWLDSQAAEAIDVAVAVRRAVPSLLDLAEAMVAALRGGGRVFFFGNGGSAADAQHWAAELSGRFYFDRPSLAAHALTTNASVLTAVGNDYGFSEVFARPLEGAGRPGDIAVGISTSGRSANVLRAFETAREWGLITVGFCGAETGAFGELCDYVVSIPSFETPRIQEGHELAAHLVFGVVEQALFGPSTE